MKPELRKKGALPFLPSIQSSIIDIAKIRYEANFGRTPPDYRVVFSPQASIPGPKPRSEDSLFGRVVYPLKTIYVNERLPAHLAVNVIIHEWLHIHNRSKSEASIRSIYDIFTRRR